MTALEAIDSRHRTIQRRNDMTSRACFNRGKIKPPMSCRRGYVSERASMGGGKKVTTSI